MPLEYVTAMVVLFNQLRKNDAVNILKHLLWSKITKALPAVCAIKYSLLSITLTILFNLADEFKEHQIGKFCESLYQLSFRICDSLWRTQRRANLDMFQQLLFWKEVGDDLIIKCERSSATNIKALGDRPVSNENYIYKKRKGEMIESTILRFCYALAAALFFDYRDRNICCGLIENVVWLLSPELLVLFNSLCAFGIYVAFFRILVNNPMQIR